MSLSDELKDGFDKNAECFDALMLKTRNHIDDLEQRLSAITLLLDEGLDSDNLEYDLQAVNLAHRIAYGGKFPQETKPDVPTPAGAIAN